MISPSSSRGRPPSSSRSRRASPSRCRWRPGRSASTRSTDPAGEPRRERLAADEGRGVASAPLPGSRCAAMRRFRGTLLPFVPLLLAGPAAGQGYLALELDGAAGATFVGGNSVAAAGDVDGDGVPDVIVGAPSAFDGFGRARVYSGATGATLRTFASSVQNDQFGFSVAGVGDLDGDGIGDVIVGILQSSAGGVTAAGRATVFSGATGLPLWSRDGTQPFDFLGSAVARVGDLDGDGVEDPAVGVIYGDNGPAFDAGRVEVLSGATGAP